MSRWLNYYFSHITNGWYPGGLHSLHIDVSDFLTILKFEKISFSEVGAGGVFWSQNWKVLKCQVMPKFEFLGGGYSELKTEKC